MPYENMTIADFARRETDQGRHLQKAVARYQKWPEPPVSPFPDVAPILKENSVALNAHNSYARATLFRRLLKLLAKELETSPPDWSLGGRLSTLTIVARDNMVFDDDVEFRIDRQAVRKARKHMTKHLQGLNYIGFVDVALYVSTMKLWNVPRLASIHGHFLVWDSAPGYLKSAKHDIRSDTSALLPYGTPAYSEVVKDGDLPQVVWYTAKMPRAQYQVYRRQGSNRYKQKKRAINQINAVRLYGAMSELTLPDLVMAGGRGVAIAEGLSEVLGPKLPA